MFTSFFHNTQCLQIFDEFIFLGQTTQAKNSILHLKKPIMPKKLSTNVKSVEAKEKKAAAQKEKSEADEKRKEDGELLGLKTSSVITKFV